VLVGGVPVGSVEDDDPDLAGGRGCAGCGLVWIFRFGLLRFLKMAFVLSAESAVAWEVVEWVGGHAAPWAPGEKTFALDESALLLARLVIAMVVLVSQELAVSVSCPVESLQTIVEVPGWMIDLGNLLQARMASLLSDNW
jgi:hypothetical protein